MDEQTIAAYNREAESIAKLHANLTPERIYQLIEQYFIPGGKTLDIGCGIGRDTHWLNQHGFPTFGVDASEAMLKQAQLLYPSHDFLQDYLPDLPKLQKSHFQNILCSAVLMHLPKCQLIPACKHLFSLLEEGGCLIISLRNTAHSNQRENGKLYESIEPDFLETLFQQWNAKILLSEFQPEKMRGLIWQNLVIQ